MPAGSERRAGRAIFAQCPDQKILRGVAVRRGDESQASLFARDMDGAPVSQSGDYQAGKVAKGVRVIERGREGRIGLGEECQTPLDALRFLARELNCASPLCSGLKAR